MRTSAVAEAMSMRSIGDAVLRRDERTETMPCASMSGSFDALRTSSSAIGQPPPVQAMRSLPPAWRPLLRTRISPGPSSASVRCPRVI